MYKRQTGNYGYGRTNQDGVFEGKVPKNELLELEVTDECGVVIYTQAFGPLSDNTCLLYTSDAADERSSVDLGGRRIIKKKKN